MEVTVASVETFPLKKEDKLAKSFKPAVEEKKSSIPVAQKFIDAVAAKRTAEALKKAKRDRKDESNHTEENDGKLKLKKLSKLYKLKYFLVICSQEKSPQKSF